MANLGKVILVFFIYAVVFLAFGSLISEKKRSCFSFSRAWLFGFFLYYTVFQIVTLPLMFAQSSLTLLSGVWAVLAGGITVWSAVKHGRRWLLAAAERAKDLAGRDLWNWIPVLIAGINVVLVSVLYVSFWDATYYVGQVSFAVYTDTINLIDPLSGEFLQLFDLKHCLATYHVNDAVFCRLFEIPPLIETKTVMVAVIAIMTNLLYYRLGSRLFQGKKKAVAVFMILTLAVNFCTYSAYSTAGFLLFRTYEGKAITANISLLTVFYLFLDIYSGEGEKRPWRLLLLVSWGAVAIASSAMFLMPAALAAGAVPYALMKRRPAVLGKMFLAMLPCLAVIACYLLGRLGWLEIAIK